MEGFELLALRGMSETLRRVSVAVVEVTPDWLVQQGGSAGELISYMEIHGFKALVPEVRWSLGMFSPKLIFTEPGPVDIQTDICFVREPQAFLAGFR